MTSDKSCVSVFAALLLTCMNDMEGKIRNLVLMFSMVSKII